MVRTIDAVDAATPLDFVLLGGDNIDSAQSNELDWMLSLLGPGGEEVDCDSGADDDPVRGRNNDPKDPFVAFGLNVPFLWVSGNHDVLIQGNIPVEDGIGTATGDFARTGTRDWSMPGGPIVRGTVVADPSRQPLSRTEVLSRVATDGDGHGVPQDAVTRGRATYAYDVPGTPLRFIVLDTTGPMASDGQVSIAEANDFVRPLLEQAQTDGKWVILASHHATTSIAEPAGALTQQEWLDLETEFPNVIFSFVGHSHEHRIRTIANSTSGHVVWEVMTSALADHPHQARLVEIWDTGSGYVRAHSTVFDFSVQGDPLAAEGRELGVLDMVAGWVPEARGTAEDRNVDLYVPAPTF
jgi:3',5'-cyclic AMP phosphodiesterase CpdA